MNQYWYTILNEGPYFIQISWAFDQDGEQVNTVLASSSNYIKITTKLQKFHHCESPDV